MPADHLMMLFGLLSKRIKANIVRKDDHKSAVFIHREEFRTDSTKRCNDREKRATIYNFCQLLNFSLDHGADGAAD